LNSYFTGGLLRDRRGSAGALEHRSRSGGFFADVAHTNDARWVPNPRGAGDVADFFAILCDERVRCRDYIAGKNKLNALAVHLAAGAHSLDDFLAGVAAFGVTDVAVLQSGFVGDLFFAEVVPEPRNALSEARGTQRGVAHRRAFVPADRIQKNLPELGKFLALGKKLCPWDSARRSLGDETGNGTYLSAVSGKFLILREVGAGNFFDKCGGLGTFQRERAIPWRFIDLGHVIHDDEFFEHFDESFANHGVGNAEEPVGNGVRLDLRKNVPLRIEQKGNDAVACGEILDVVGQDSVEVAHAVGAGKGEISAVVLVDQSDGVAGGAILGGCVTEVIRQGAAEPHTHLRAGGSMQRGKRSSQSCSGCGHFRVSVVLLALSLPKSGAGHVAGDANPFISNDILPFMSEGRTALNASIDGLIHITIPVGMLQCNCSIIGDPATREALVIDPGDEVNRILDLLGRHKLIVKVIVSTHAHIDHVGGLSKLHQYTGAPVLMHRDDLPLYQAMDMQAAFLGVHPPDLTEVDQLLKEGDVLRWGGFEAIVLHTPGHTPGSVSLFLPHDAGRLTGALNLGRRDAPAAEDMDAPAAEEEEVDIPEEPKRIVFPGPQLFCGDTLFAGSIGRTDLWGGSTEKIMESLRTKLMILPDETTVHPGHGPATTIGTERELNPFLRPE